MITDIHISNIGYKIENFSDEHLENMVPPQSHILPPISENRPFYLVSREDWPNERFLDKEYHGRIIPQLLDFGSGEKTPLKIDPFMLIIENGFSVQIFRDRSSGWQTRSHA